MPTVIDSDVRFTLNHVLDSSHTVDVVLDYSLVVPGGDAAERQAAILQLAENVIDAWVVNLIPHLCHDVSFQSVSWVDYDSDSGSTGRTSTTETNTLPMSGTGRPQSQSAQVCWLIHKGTTSGRGTRPGRMYLPVPSLAGTTDSDGSDGNGPEAADLIAVPASLNAFQIYTEAFPAAMGMAKLSVAHNKAGTLTPVQGWTLDPVFGTQRRRLRG